MRAARRVQALRKLPCGSRVGWGAFTASRTLLLLAPVEVCDNYNDLLASLAQIDGRMRWAEASEISKGLYWAVDAARSTPSKPNIMFISDGQEAPPLESLDLPSALDKLKDHPIRGWVMGAGGDDPSPIPKIDPDGNHHGFWRPDEVIQSEAAVDGATPGLEHFSALREQHLTRLAEVVKLDYARLTDQKSLVDAMTDRRFARHRQVPTDLSWLAATLALLLLIVRFRPARLRGSGSVPRTSEALLPPRGRSRESCGRCLARRRSSSRPELRPAHGRESKARSHRTG